MKTYNLTIKGVTPLLMNKPKEYGFDSKLKINNPNIDTKKEAIEKIYSIDGVIYTPSTHIWMSMVNASKDLKIKGKGKASYSKMVASMIQVVPDVIPHKFTDFDIFSCMTVNPTTRGRIMTHRPRFSKWELDFQLIVDDEIPEVVVKEAIERAGKYVGIGDWRPDKKGVFGKFMVIRFEEAKE